MPTKITFLFLYFFILTCWSCNTTKTLADDDFLIVENKLEIDNKDNLLSANTTISELYELINPSANSKWNKIPVLIYNKNQLRVAEGKKERFKRFAEKPSIYNEKDVEVSCLKLEKYLLDHGYIGSKVNSSYETNGKKVKIRYALKTQPAHTIKSVSHISDSTTVGRLLMKFTKYRSVKVGDIYSKDNIDKERTRYAETLRNSGFINITEDFFYFTVDTQFVEHVVDVGIHFKVPADKEILKRYKIGNTYLNWNSTINNQDRSTKKDTFEIKPGLFSIGSLPYMKAKLIDLSVDQDRGEYISEKKQKLTLNHFLSYNLFKHVNQKYSKTYGDSLDIIDRYIDLSYDSDGSIGTDLEFNNRSGSFFGTAVTGSYTNKNLFKGAEIFDASLTLGAEVQANQNQNFLNSVLVEVGSSLSVPQLLIPSFIKYKPSSFFIPKTFVSLKNSAQNRIDSYSAIESSLALGYSWRETKKSNHELSLLSFSYQNIFNRSPDFVDLELNNRRLALSLQDLFDIGIEYTYTFTNQSSRSRKTFSYFSIFARTAGNTLNAIIKETNNQNEKTILNTPFSQYAKLQLDYRHYIPIKKSILIGKIVTGLNYAYGNSTEVPYGQQFIVGGSQSLRGFVLRGLGPGEFVLQNNPNNTVENQLFDQTGDVKLEMNLEFRFPIYGYFKGATFVDAGNIWLVNEDPTKPGARFDADSFLKQTALNTGFGLRFDIENFIVIRVDLAAVLRRPYLNEGFQWTTTRPDAFTRTWFGENLTLQGGIGYPF